MWDQADFDTFRGQLEADITRHEATLKAAGKQVPARPTPVTGDTIATCENLEMHAARLRGLIRTAAKVAAKQTEAATPASTAANTEKKSFDALVAERTKATAEKRQAQENLAVELLEKVRAGELSLTQACEQARAAK